MNNARRACLASLLWPLPALAADGKPPTTTEPRSADRSPEALVLAQRGTLPIVVSVPHGGSEAIPGIPPRNVEGKPKTGDNAYVAGGDARTAELALAMSAAIRRLSGQTPYLVLARFQRRFVDANRLPPVAFDSEAARPYWERYHALLREYVDEIRRTHSAGLLIDLHGQNQDGDVLMRGTRNGRTVARLLARAGPAAITGPEGLFGQLQANGFNVFPSNSLPVGGRTENGGFNGGPTVERYGSHRADGIDAVQFEFGTRYREPAMMEQSALWAARAIVAFQRRWLAGG